MIYVAFRGQKKRGKRKKGKDVVIFDLAEWTRITSLVVENSQRSENVADGEIRAKKGVG